MHESTKADFGNRIKKALCPHTGHSVYLAEWQHSPISCHLRCPFMFACKHEPERFMGGQQFQKKVQTFALAKLR
jgi:hypothetical protein